MSPAYVPRSVGLATLALAAAVAAWALVTPGFRASDEPQHVSTVVRLATGGGFPPAGSAMVDARVLAAEPLLGFPGIAARHDGDPVGPRPAERGGDAPLRALSDPGLPREGPQADQMTQHPPGYYAALAAVTVAGGLLDRPPADALLVLRLVSGLMLLPLPWLCASVARRLGLGGGAAVAAAWLPLACPQLAIVGATVNNGTPLVVGGALLAWLLVPVCLGARLGVGRGLAIGLVLGASLLVKGFALAFVLPVALALFAAVRRHGWRPVIGPAAVVLAAALPGLGWWAANLAQYGTLQPGGAPLLPGAEQLSLAEWAWRFLRALASTWWLALGWLETAPPLLVAVGLTVGALAVVGVGTWWVGRWVPGGRAVAAVLHALWLGPLLVVLVGSFGAWVEVAAVRGVQGRYLQTGALTVCVLGAAGLTAGRLGRRVLPYVPVAAAVVATAALVVGLLWFWAPGTPGTAMTWWPLPSGLLWVLLAVPGGLSLVQVMWGLRRPATPSPTPTPLGVAGRG